METVRKNKTEMGERGIQTFKWRMPLTDSSKIWCGQGNKTSTHKNKSIEIIQIETQKEILKTTKFKSCGMILNSLS